MIIDNKVIEKISLPIFGSTIGGLAFQRIGLKASFYISSLGFVILF